MFIQQTGRARCVYQEMRMEHRQDGNKRSSLSMTFLLITWDKLTIWSDYAWHHATQFQRERANRTYVLCISSPLFF